MLHNVLNGFEQVPQIQLISNLVTSIYFYSIFFEYDLVLICSSLKSKLCLISF